MANCKTVILVVGATATGKTAVAIELAKHFGAEIISADSRQCFKELKIGVARPSDEELASVKHHFVASLSIHDSVSAASFEAFAIQRTAELFRTHDVVIVSGGTGLYIKAFLEGLDPIPGLSEEIRQRIGRDYHEKGMQWLQDQVRQKDPVFFKVGEIQNPHRLMRALEVTEATGKSILDFRKGKKEPRDFNVVKLGLELPRVDLHQRINDRVDQMIKNGLVEEVKGLSAYRSLNALQTVGYSEIFDYLDGKISLDGAIELIRQNTRQYAKRQITWFKKDKEIKWYRPSQIPEMEREVEQAVTAVKSLASYRQ